MEQCNFVESCIKTLVEHFLQTPYAFWRESDVKCYFYSLLSKTDLQNWHWTLDGKRTNLIHTEYKTRLGGRFDIAVFDPENVEQFPFNNQKLLCGVELGLDRGSEHFTADFLYKFRKETTIPVKIGYIIHLMRDKLLKWNATLKDIESLMPSNAGFFVQPTNTGKCGALVVKIEVEKQEA